MNLLEDAWIPVRADGGTGVFRLLTYRELLCEPGNWQVSLPRDDLELACVQLLVCMTQVMFLPEDVPALRARLETPLSPEAFAAGVKPCLDWFDLDHPTQPFMQSRGVKAAESTPIQKLLIGLPEGNNHAFFNEVGEVRRLSGSLAAICLFNQAANSPSFGGGFKGSLRGGAPITTLVAGKTLRDTVWRNVLTRPHIMERQIRIPGFEQDQPTWVKPISEKTTIHWNEIGLVRGLFWQPARVELVKSEVVAPCDVLGGEAVPMYTGFDKEKFNFIVEGVWPHPHGAMTMSLKNGALEQKFSSFTTTAPAWTMLSEFVVPKNMDDPGAREGSIPAGPVSQANELDEGSMHLLIGGYRTKQASVLERRHELMSLAQGWSDDKGRLKQLVDLGKEAKKALRGKLYFAVQGSKDKGLKGIGAAIHETSEKLFYARTESLIHEVFSNVLTFTEWKSAKAGFTKQLATHCRVIFEELTDPYAMKPELIPVIAWARRSLNSDLAKLREEA
ncbi:MAG TPA: type I-E CRISPR-associated protein Cse1/CasA [Terracidiphilus sp.]|nr:type I-E CRISPR-associated protein Cse1/CasA [Terracidiphilus sp.]